MKKIIRTGDLCCKICAERTAAKLLSVNGVVSAKADYKKQMIFVEVEDDSCDDDMRALIEDCGFEVKSIERRKGLFS